MNLTSSHLNDVELWTDIRTQNHFEVLGTILRNDFKNQRAERVDLSYLSTHINQWWQANQTDIDSNTKVSLNISLLKSIILKNLKEEHHNLVKNLGIANANIAAILFDHVFDISDKNLAHLIHESFTQIAGIVDIKYPYEEHKELYPKISNQIASDWGKGIGMIRPHSDDLYEYRDINAMCLTVCKDTSSTPTWFWLINDIVSCLSDEELGLFALSDATFYSGTNVEGHSIQITKPILRNDNIEGLGLRIDFRIDDKVGPRMRFNDSKVQLIFDKMRNGLKKIKPISSTPKTGSVGLLANFKILHGRSYLNPVMLYDGESSRILFRSKGIR